MAQYISERPHTCILVLSDVVIILSPQMASALHLLIPPFVLVTIRHMDVHLGSIGSYQPRIRRQALSGRRPGRRTGRPGCRLRLRPPRHLPFPENMPWKIGCKGNKIIYY